MEGGTTKKVAMLEVSPLLSRPPVILALGHGYTLRNFAVCIVPFTGYSKGGKKPSKQLENQIFILCGRLLLSRVFLFWRQETI